MTPDTYIQLTQEAITLKGQLDALAPGSGMRSTVLSQLAENVLVVRQTMVHEHLAACAAPHDRCGWNTSLYPFDVRDEDAWVGAAKVKLFAEAQTKIRSGSVAPFVVTPVPEVALRTTPLSS